MSNNLENDTSIDQIVVHDSVSESTERLCDQPAWKRYMPKLSKPSLNQSIPSLNSREDGIIVEKIEENISISPQPTTSIKLSSNRFGPTSLKARLHPSSRSSRSSRSSISNPYSSDRTTTKSRVKSRGLIRLGLDGQFDETLELLQSIQMKVDDEYE